MNYILTYRSTFETDDHGNCMWYTQKAQFNTLEEIVEFCTKLYADVIAKDDTYVAVDFISIYKIEDNLLTENIQEEIKRKAQDKAKDILEAKQKAEEIIKQTELLQQQEKERQEYLRLKRIYDNSN